MNELVDIKKFYTALCVLLLAIAGCIFAGNVNQKNKYHIEIL